MRRAARRCSLAAEWFHGYVLFSLEHESGTLSAQRAVRQDQRWVVLEGLAATCGDSLWMRAAAS